MSFILQFVRRECPIKSRLDILNIECQNPLVILAAFGLERVHGLEREDGNYTRSTTIRHSACTITTGSHRK